MKHADFSAYYSHKHACMYVHCAHTLRMLSIHLHMYVHDVYCVLSLLSLIRTQHVLW